MTDLGRKSLLAGIGIVCALLAGEIALRLLRYGDRVPLLQFDQNTRVALQRGQFVPDKLLFWRPADAAYTETDRAIRSVRPGMAAPPKSGRKRILVVGDSCSRLSMQGLPYPGQLEQLLGPERVEVFTAAVPGYTSYQGSVWLRSDLLRLRPDVVIVYFGWNDHWRSTGLTDREYARRHAPAHLRLVDLLRGKPRTPPLRVPLDDYRRNLTDMVEAARGAGAEPILVAAPYAVSAEATAHLRQTRYVLPGDNVLELDRSYGRQVSEVAATSRARLFDAEALFTRLAAPDRLLHRDGIHPTDLGHRVLALGLASDIARHDLGDPATVPDPLAAAAQLLAQAPDSNATTIR